MEVETNKLIRKYLKKDRSNLEPPKHAPTEFWLSVLYYQKMFNSGLKYHMDGIEDFSHLSIHSLMELDEMVGKYPEAWLFWMFEEIGWFDPEPHGDPDKLVIWSKEGYWDGSEGDWGHQHFATTFTKSAAAKVTLPAGARWVSQAEAYLDK